MKRSTILICSLAVVVACDNGSDDKPINCDTGFVLQGNECVDVDECAAPGVTFVKESFTTAEDCITPEVCISRGDQGPIYNTVVDEGGGDQSCDSTAPTGTLWTRGTCASVLDADFDTFLSDAYASCEPPSIVDVAARLKLVGGEGDEDDRYFDVEFDAWGAGGHGGSFAYTRTESLCGPGSVCVNTPGSYTCECPAGFTRQDGACVDVDECAAATDACDASATCENLVGTYRCACEGEVPFAKTADGSEEDCITDDVCLTRGAQYPIYNSVLDAPPTDNVSENSAIPTGTTWAIGTCAEVTPNQFGAFLSARYADRNPPSVVDVPSCLKIDDRYLDLTFTSWATGTSGGGAFSYVRSVAVPPGVACE